MQCLDVISDNQVLLLNCKISFHHYITLSQVFHIWGITANNLCLYVYSVYTRTSTNVSITEFFNFIVLVKGDYVLKLKNELRYQSFKASRSFFCIYKTQGCITKLTFVNTCTLHKVQNIYAAIDKHNLAIGCCLFMPRPCHSD